MLMRVGKAKKFGLNSNSVRFSQSISRLNNAHGTCVEQTQVVFHGFFHTIIQNESYG